jgi:heme/copper-type cytochrome/quinol oxidase subunit 4
MDTHDLKSLLVPLLAAIGLTILAVLVAVYLGFAWD